MAKNGFGKILTGVAVIGAGVALGLAVYNRLDTIKRELNDDEFEDDFPDDEMDDAEAETEEHSYVTINTAATAGETESSVSDAAEDSEDTAGEAEAAEETASEEA